MAVTDSLATAAEYRTAIRKDDTTDDTEILNDITAVTRYMERALGCFFTKDASAIARDYYAPSQGPVYPEAENPWKYAGKYTRTLHLDTDLVSVTTLVTDDNSDGTPETTWAATDYQLIPLNADKGSEARPYTALYCPQWSTKLGWPPTRIVRITGVWGWPAVPAAVKRGAINLAAILRLESPRSSRNVSSIGDVISVSKEAQGIVDDLTRVYGRASV